MPALGQAPSSAFPHGAITICTSRKETLPEIRRDLPRLPQQWPEGADWNPARLAPKSEWLVSPDWVWASLWTPLGLGALGNLERGVRLVARGSHGSHGGPGSPHLPRPQLITARPPTSSLHSLSLGSQYVASSREEIHMHQAAAVPAVLQADRLTGLPDAPGKLGEWVSAG